MSTLTLKDCLSQPNGTEGRLFEVDNQDQEAYRSFHDSTEDSNITGTYRVLKVEGDQMEIEGYILGGRTGVVKGVPIKERMKDSVLNSDFLMDCYRVMGKAGSNPATAHLTW